MKPRLLLIASAFLFMLGCVTTYRPEGFGGGYTDIPLGKNRYRIDVRGNGYTDMQRVRDIAMVRAADLAISNGFAFFKVLETGSDTDLRVGSYQGQVYSVRNQYVSLVIEFTNDDEDVEAASIIRILGPKVGYY